MTQIPLTLTPPEEKPPRKRVRDTSRAAYADGRARFTGRKADVLQWLAAYYNHWQIHPTSAELAHTRWAQMLMTHQAERLLYVRRGISDLQTVGVVEAAGKRTCAVSGRTVETWRVVSR